LYIGIFAKFKKMREREMVKTINVSTQINIDRL